MYYEDVCHGDAGYEEVYLYKSLVICFLKICSYSIATANIAFGKEHSWQRMSMKLFVLQNRVTNLCYDCVTVNVLKRHVMMT